MFKFLSFSLSLSLLLSDDDVGVSALTAFIVCHSKQAKVTVGVQSYTGRGVICSTTTPYSSSKSKRNVSTKQFGVIVIIKGEKSFYHSATPTGSWAIGSIRGVDRTGLCGIYISKKSMSPCALREHNNAVHPFA
uniref:Putative secreted peptide n=1 Tax=Anopheles braziliensis TaxID=58242 RepID=A0A2M3ZNZ8_9DIPT